MKLLMIPVLLLALAATAGEEQPQTGDQVAIAVQNQFIYPMPAFYASPTEPVSYGTLAAIDEVQGEWFRITTSGNRSGWIHRTAVTGAIESSYGGTTASGSVTSDEIMLAGRGFSSDMEQAYASDNPELDFAMVDRMVSSWKVSSADLYTFLVEGNLIDDTGVAGQPGTPATPTGGTRR